MKYRNIIKILLIVFIFLSCNSQEQKIRKVLCQKDRTLWGMYDDMCNSLGMSLMLYKDGKCDNYDENAISVGGKPMMPQYDNTWNVEIADKYTYLRCLITAYKVLNYNENYFELLTNSGKKIYLYKSPCQSHDCFIPKKMPTAPF